MSASICRECEQPRDYGATLLHVCHCDETAGDLRVLIHLRDTELTRLRAALESIAALQTEEPDDDPPNPNNNGTIGWLLGRTAGLGAGRYEAASVARRALDGGK